MVSLGSQLRQIAVLLVGELSMIADNNSNDWPVQLAFDPKKVDKPRDQSKKSLQ